MSQSHMIHGITDISVSDKISTIKEGHGAGRVYRVIKIEAKTDVGDIDIFLYPSEIDADFSIASVSRHDLIENADEVSK